MQTETSKNSDLVKLTSYVWFEKSNVALDGV